MSKYIRKIKGVEVDVYDILQAWDVRNPALQHLIKKALQPGQRGHKSREQDLQDIIASALRAIELEGFKSRNTQKPYDWKQHEIGCGPDAKFVDSEDSEGGLT